MGTAVQRVALRPGGLFLSCGLGAAALSAGRLWESAGLGGAVATHSWCGGGSWGGLQALLQGLPKTWVPASLGPLLPSAGGRGVHNHAPLGECSPAPPPLQWTLLVFGG